MRKSLCHAYQKAELLSIKAGPKLKLNESAGKLDSQCQPVSLFKEQFLSFIEIEKKSTYNC